eukprot:GHVS01039974.1.p2 GENE.GHVS01039974.1~~GHVS01039974.1.p2  ORF type:complete len:145 (+),score=20.62 GHVS01039974.1:201-635(+)
MAKLPLSRKAGPPGSATENPTDGDTAQMKVSPLSKGLVSKKAPMPPMALAKKAALSDSSTEKAVESDAEKKPAQKLVPQKSKSSANEVDRQPPLAKQTSMEDKVDGPPTKSLSKKSLVLSKAAPAPEVCLTRMLCYRAQFSFSG